MPGLFGKIRDGLGWVGDRVENGLMPAPTDGLLSASDIASGRRQGMFALGASLLTPGSTAMDAFKAAHGEYADAIDRDITGQQTRMKLAQAKRLAAARAEMATKFAPQDGETVDERNSRLQAMYAHAVRNQDFETAKALDPVVSVISKSSEPKSLLDVDAGDHKELRDPITGKVVQSIKVAPKPIDPDVLALRQQSANATTQAAKDRAENRLMAMGQSDGHSFTTLMKPVMVTAQKVAQWNTARDEARKGNPSAFKSAILGFIANADGNPTIRQGLINYLGQVAPDLQGNTEMTLDRLSKGRIPDKIIQNMDNIVQAGHRATRAIYERRYQGQTSRNPYSANYIPSPEEVFGTEPAATTLSPDNPWRKK